MFLLKVNEYLFQLMSEQLNLLLVGAISSNANCIHARLFNRLYSSNRVFKSDT